MMHPKDAFGRMMLQNLEDRGCQLLGLKECPDEDSHKQRMLSCGMTASQAWSMLYIHNNLLNKKERSRIEKLEIFDEFEEWDMLQSHYLICISSRSSHDHSLSF
jgi:tRNA wybutosine-synthesizing protein 4